MLEFFTEFSLITLGLGCLGILLGAMFGAMPGLGPSSAVALLLPFAVAMPALDGMVFVLCAYAAANYGGAVPAVLIGVPGDPGSAATVLDGYPMTRKGQGTQALALVATGSAIATVLGFLAFIFFASYLARVALSFGPPEFFMLIVLGMTILITLDMERVLKGFLAGLLGLLLGTVGLDSYWAESRMVFGYAPLYDGFPLLPTLLGIFCVSQMLALIDEKKLVRGDSPTDISIGSTAREMLQTLKYWRTIGVSSVIGIIVGALPGAGAAIAGFVAYNYAKLRSKRPEEFGQGAPEGVIAPEAANNAQVGGSLVPTLALGIPGNATTAIFLGAMLLLGLRPGPRLFLTEGDLLQTLVGYLLLGSVFMLFLGLIGARYFFKMAQVRVEILVPVVLIVSAIGSYSTRGQVFDILIMIGFGALSFVLLKFRYSLAALCLGFLLGPMAEEYFIQSMAMSAWNYSIFVTRPVSILLGIGVVIAVGASVVALRIVREREAQQSTTDEPTSKRH